MTHLMQITYVFLKPWVETQIAQFHKIISPNEKISRSVSERLYCFVGHIIDEGSHALLLVYVVFV
jgi:hypothetical protein